MKPFKDSPQAYKFGLAVQGAASYADKVAELVPGLGDITTGGAYFIGTLPKTFGRFQKDGVVAAARTFVGGSVGALVTAIPFLDWIDTAIKGKDLAIGKGWGASRSMAERVDDAISGEDRRQFHSLIDTVPSEHVGNWKKGSRTKGDSGMGKAVAVAAMLPVVGGAVSAVNRGIEGVSKTATQVASGEVALAAQTITGAAAGATIDLAGAGVADAAIGAAELVQNGGNITATIDWHQGLADRVQASISGNGVVGKHTAKLAAEGHKSQTMNSSHVAALQQQPKTGGGRGLTASASMKAPVRQVPTTVTS